MPTASATPDPTAPAHAVISALVTRIGSRPYFSPSVAARPRGGQGRLAITDKLKRKHAVGQGMSDAVGMIESFRDGETARQTFARVVRLSQQLLRHPVHDIRAYANIVAPEGRTQMAMTLHDIRAGADACIAERTANVAADEGG
jgi:hypothetical protein